MRTPILSIGAHFSGSFACYEKQQRVNGQLQPRYRAVELARIDDAFMIDYIAGRRHQQLGSLMSRSASELELTVADVLAYYDLATCAETQIVDALRRLAGTLITLDHWKGRQYSRSFPLIEARRVESGRFAIKTSAWLDDELMDGELVSAPRSASRLSSFRFRLDGWARSWVGRNPRIGEQIITKRDALARVGALPNQMPGTAWEHLVAVVTANDLPSSNVKLIQHRGQPAIAIEQRRQANRSAGMDPGLADQLGNDDDTGLSLNSDDEADASARPREISLEPDEPEPIAATMPSPLQALAPGDFNSVIRPRPAFKLKTVISPPEPNREIFLD